LILSIGYDTYFHPNSYQLAAVSFTTAKMRSEAFSYLSRCFGVLSFQHSIVISCISNKRNLIVWLV